MFHVESLHSVRYSLLTDRHFQVTSLFSTQHELQRQFLLSFLCLFKEVFNAFKLFFLMTIFLSKGEERTACRTSAVLPNQQFSDSCLWTRL